MAQNWEEMDRFAGSFRKEIQLRGRITSPTAHLHKVGGASHTTAGGGQLIRDQVDSSQDPRALGYRGPSPATKPALETAIRSEVEDPELGRVASEMQLLIDLPEDWPGWSFARRAVKRTLDVVLSLLAFCALLPVLAVIALAVKVESAGPVFYRQRRCGRDGRSFEMVKFRSMIQGADQLLVDLRERNDSDGLLFKIRHDPRVTRVGAFIRRYSLDELPQLINVLRGEMSLVGPRPLPLDSEAFGPIDGQRHAVRPGLTCHWQVSGRSGVSYGQMVEMDLGYIRDSSIWTDLRLIVITVPVAIGGKGAY